MKAAEELVMGRWMVIVVAAGLWLAACGEAAEVFPAGVWTNTCERGTVKVFEFRDDGTYTGTFHNPSDGLHVETVGTYSTTDATLTFETDAVCGESPGVYGWSMEQGAMLLSLVEDGCEGRIAAMDGYLFTPLEGAGAAG